MATNKQTYLVGLGIIIFTVIIFGGTTHVPSHYVEQIVVDEFERLPVVRRFYARHRMCPWGMMREWAAAAERKIRAAPTLSDGTPIPPRDAFLLYPVRSGPGFGVALAIEANTLMLGMLTGRPVYRIQCRGHSVPPFNHLGSLIGSKTLRKGWYDITIEDCCRGGVATRGVTNDAGDWIEGKCPLPHFGDSANLSLPDYNIEKEEKKGIWKFSKHVYDKGTFRLEEHFSAQRTLIVPGWAESDAMPFLQDGILDDMRYSRKAQRLGARLSDYSAPGCILRMLLDNPSDEVRGVVQTTLMGLPRDALLISIHVRRGDYAMGTECGVGGCVHEREEEAKNGEERVDSEFVQNILKSVKSKLVDRLRARGTKVGVFLASDTKEVEKQARSFFPDLLTVPGVAYHSSKQNLARTSDLKIAADFVLLSLADICIRSSSSFGGMAFEMGGCGVDYGGDTRSGRQIIDHGEPKPDVLALIDSIALMNYPTVA